MIYDLIFEPFFRMVQAAALGMLVLVVNTIRHSPEPNLTALWYRGSYHLMLQIGAYATIAVALGAGISAVLKGGTKELIRIFVVGVPISIFGGVAAISLVALLQQIDQSMTNAVLDATESHFQTFYDRMNASGDALTGAAIALFLFFIFISLQLMLIFLMIEMVFRQIMIYMAVLFIPLALGAYVWAPLRGWFTGLAEVIVTMVLSKFIIAAVMSFGLVSINHAFVATDVLGTVSAMLAGLLTFFTACVAAPMILIFVMSPSHDVLRRGQVVARLPFGADNSYGRGKARQSIGSVANRVRGKK